MNNRLSMAVSETYVRIPLEGSPHILAADALEIDWEEHLPASECSFVLGNPPFQGTNFKVTYSGVRSFELHLPKELAELSITSQLGSLKRPPTSEAPKPKSDSSQLIPSPRANKSTNCGQHYSRGIVWQLPSLIAVSLCLGIRCKREGARPCRNCWHRPC